MSQQTVIEPPAPAGDDDPSRPGLRRLLGRKALLSGVVVALVIAASAVGVARVTTRHHHHGSTLATGSSTTTYSAFVTMGPQAMEGDLKLSPGDALKAGYDFTIPGSHPDDVVTFQNTTWTFNYTCVNGPGSGTITLNAAPAAQDDPPNSSAWYPSGDQKSPMVFQSQTFTYTGAECGGGQMRLQQGGTFKTSFTATAGNAVHIRWHYSAHGTAGGWSGTGSFSPEPCYPNCP